MGDAVLAHNDITRIIRGERGDENTSFRTIMFEISFKTQSSEFLPPRRRSMMRDFRTHVILIRLPPYPTSRDVTSHNGKILGIGKRSENVFEALAFG